MKKYEIAKKKTLTPEIGQISVYAPLVAAKAKAGQFIILRVDEEGERIPLTISSAVDGLITVIYQKIGGTTLALDELNEGDCLHDFVGPLGQPTEVEDLGRVAVLGGGLGCAIALPVARALHEAGNQVDLIGGFKTKDVWMAPTLMAIRLILMKLSPATPLIRNMRPRRRRSISAAWEEVP